MKENIFAELYNKLLGLFRQAEEEGNSKDVARNRLRVVLMQDRTNLTPQLLEKMRGELVELLSKYLEMDKDALELNLDQDGEQMALALSIPVIRAKDEEEIEQAIAEEEAKKAESESHSEQSEESDADEATEEDVAETEVAEDEKQSETETETKSNKTEKKSEKKIKFPNKEICGDCKECEFSDDIECEKKNQTKKV